MTFSNAFPRLRFAVAPVRTLTFRRVDGSRIGRLKARRVTGKAPAKARRDASGNANVALIMAVMMSLVFGPVIGVHLIAAFAPPVATASDVVARTGGSAIPPG